MATNGEAIENPRTGQQMRFVVTSKESGGALLRIDCTNPAGGVKEPEHIHPFQENRFELLKGTLVFCIAGEQRQARAGDVVVIPPNVPHFFWNASDEPAHYVQEFRPALRSELFFETLFGLARDGKLNERGTASLLQMAAVVPQFWNEIRVTHPPPAVQRVVFSLLGPISRVLGYRSDGS